MQSETDWAPSLCSRTRSDKQDGVMTLDFNEFWAPGQALRQTWQVPLTLRLCLSHFLHTQPLPVFFLFLRFMELNSTQQDV